METRPDAIRRRLLHALGRAAEKQSQRADIARQTTFEMLERSAREAFADTRIVIASSREPYQHVHRDGRIETIRSAGGLATALDSVARATRAVWVAQASGDADRETADEHGRIAMPPGHDQYTLQRLWVEDEERAEGFNRFANGCLWPLCHVVYVRPHFIASHWRAYREVNRQFADAVVEAAGAGPALVLLQDYHLAACAADIRARRPDLTIVLFWHIPWPNPEVFRILPWKRDIIEGLLACDLLGFHIRFHGINFMETVSTELEALVDRERWAVRRKGRKTFVRAYPISPDVAEYSLAAGDPAIPAEVKRLRERLGLREARVILGVDRLDYTKGIPERLEAFGMLLERHPDLRGHVAMVQIAVPSRVNLPEYQALARDVEERVAQLNQRFGAKGPVVHLIAENLDFRELIPFYAMADVMAVTSLHDGMNLVSKEFVASKPDLKGVLVLSPYTGASRELEDAIQVSPYDAEGLVGALQRALVMKPDEVERRMRALREVVASQNIYDWARKILRDVKRLRLMSAATRRAARR